MAARNSFVDESGVTRLEGELTGPVDPVTSHSVLGGASTLVTDGAFLALPWNIKSAGDDLLDFTDHAAPTVKEAGTYAISAFIAPVDPMTAGGSYVGYLDIDQAGPDYEVGQSAAAVAGELQPNVTVAATWYLHAGAVVTISVKNLDGGADRHFQVNTALVQRIA